MAKRIIQTEPLIVWGYINNNPSILKKNEGLCKLTIYDKETKRPLFIKKQYLKIKADEVLMLFYLWGLVFIKKIIDNG
jgi:hypothetical protein